FRKFCTDFFDEGNAPTDPHELGRHGADKIKGKLDELRATVTASKYPFVEQLNGPISLLEQASGKQDDWYLSEYTLGDELLEAKEGVSHPSRSFLRGPERAISDDATALLGTQACILGYLPPGSDEAVRTALGDPNAFRGNKRAHLTQATGDLL